MDEKQVFSTMQTSLNLGNTSDFSLGGLVIVSALITEFALARILFAEGDKIDEAVGTEGVTPAQLALVDDSVAGVLEQVCCIEARVVEKIREGINLRNFDQPL